MKNDIGRRNEVWVDALRSHRGAQVLDQFGEVTDQRLAALRAMDDAAFGAESWTPVGPGTVRDLLPFRIFDSWVHEQDTRRALGRPGDVDGAVGAFALGRIAGSMPYVVGKKVKPPDGTTVVFEYGGEQLAIGVEGGRAKPLDAAPSDPTVRLAMEVDTFVRLGCGRGDPAQIVDSGAVDIGGDGQLGRNIASEMNFLF